MNHFLKFNGVMRIFPTYTEILEYISSTYIYSNNLYQNAKHINILYKNH